MEATSDSTKPSFVTRLFRGALSWRTARRILIGLAGLITFIAVFYAVENSRGKRAWEECKRVLESKGQTLDWSAYIPPPVPDDQNVFKAPKMQEWFVGRGETELSRKLNHPLTIPLFPSEIVTKDGALKYIEWSHELEPHFALIRKALERPYARIEGDYVNPVAVPIPNFITVRALAQTLAQRAHCHLLLQNPDEALRDVTLLHDLRRLLEGRPSDKSMTLVAAMVNVAVTGLYSEAVSEGLRLHVWRVSDLLAIEMQLNQRDLIPLVSHAFQTEPAAVCQILESTPAAELDKMFSESDHSRNWILNRRIQLMPRGWVYQSMVRVANRHSALMERVDLDRKLIRGASINHSDEELRSKNPYNFLAAETLSNYVPAWRSVARSQTMINQCLIACALERFRLAQDKYPESLSLLVPRFLEKVPHDIIGGKPLQYRRTDDGQFLLYSVGWNEIDDGGRTVLKEDGKQDVEQGDWVWTVSSQ